MQFLAEQHPPPNLCGGMQQHAEDRGGVSLDNFDWWSLTPDWNEIEEQVRRLAPPYVDGPPLVPEPRQRHD